MGKVIPIRKANTSLCVYFVNPGDGFDVVTFTSKKDAFTFRENFKSRLVPQVYRLRGDGELCHWHWSSQWFPEEDGPRAVIKVHEEAAEWRKRWGI